MRRLFCVDAILDNDVIYELGDLVPVPPREHGGRPRDFPAWAYFFYDALISVVRSVRRVETELGSQLMWEHVRRRVVERFPNQPERWLQAKSITRDHWDYARTHYLADVDVWPDLKDTFVRRDMQAGASARALP